MRFQKEQEKQREIAAQKARDQERRRREKERREKEERFRRATEDVISENLFSRDENVSPFNVGPHGDGIHVKALSLNHTASAEDNATTKKFGVTIEDSSHPNIVSPTSVQDNSLATIFTKKQSNDMARRES